jgi:predicted DNA-binding protein with PD1-like motif
MKIERFSKNDIKGLFAIRLNPGDDLLLSIRRAVSESGIQNALILSGVGSVTSHHYHVVSTPVNPPAEDFVKGDKAADIVNINGCVIDGRVHAHIIFSDKDKCFGGHLEEGVHVLTFAILSMVELDKSFQKWDTIGNIEDLLI